MKIHLKPCPECNGSGTMTYERVHRQSASNDSGFIEEYEADCDNCGGSGEIEDDDYDPDEYGDWLMHKQQDEELCRD